MKKKVLMMLPCIAAVAIATVVGKKTYEKNAFEGNALLAQNVEALSQGDTGGGSSECEFGSPIYAEVGAYYGKTNTRIHYEEGGNIDHVYKDVTYTQCYAFKPNCGERKGANGIINVDWGTYSIEPCKGSSYHYNPFSK